jgi:D-alanyl-D-alanine carboxypeptidase/D-alanyl-D-alanine-endopeptidase (penicillin-binding protein 4)
MVAGKPTVLGAGLPGRLEPAARIAVQDYLDEAAGQGKGREEQGVWLQSTHKVLGHYQGTVPLPAASLTKVATTLAALRTWGPAHRFETFIEATGPIRGGVLQGDLVIRGGDDPFFVWEDAIILGNALQALGLQRVTGNLLVVGNFYMNFTANPLQAGRLFKQSVRAEQWSKSLQAQYHTLPPGTLRPHLVISGVVQVVTVPPRHRMPLIRHASLPMVQILKRMNVYSNNIMAQMLADALGGVQQVRQRASQTAHIPADELHLINGSGLGKDNQMSPRAACAMLMAIQRLLHPANLTIANVFPVAGLDRGTIRRRQLPEATVVKTGSLRGVSALAGVMITRTHGPVWFALLNQGDDIREFRAQQDVLLQRLQASWGSVDTPVADVTPMPLRLEDSRDAVLVGIREAGVRKP